MKCFYHIDEDGKCAAFWVKYALMLRDGYNYNNDDFRKINYGFDFPFDDIEKDEEVYIVDFSISPEEMDTLLDITKNVTWIDHHITAIDKYKNYNKYVPGLRFNGIAGCMLTYCYMMKLTRYGKETISDVFDPVKMIQDAPLFTKYIADMDVWKFEYGDNTRNFCLGFASEENTEPYDDIWMDMINFPDKIENTLIENGKIISKYKKSFAKEYLKSKSFKTVFEGHLALAMNIGLIGSDWFESADNIDDYDMFISFSFGGKRWSYTLYSSKIDVSEIAKKYGGGGHTGAAGFSSEELLIKEQEYYDTKIISAFPGCGKTYLFNKLNEDEIICLDSDSSNFSWIYQSGNKERNQEFPYNYMKHIKENIGKYKYIFVSSHDIVRKALNDNGIEFTLVYPDINIKNEYIQRYIDRGSDSNFIRLLEEKYDEWICECENDENTKNKVRLQKFQYLSDVIDDIL